jgi:N-carbamoylputrescine amidase
MPVLTVGTIQLACEDGRPDANLARAGRLVERAARDGAQLALLPEFVAAGYAMTPSLWRGAEPSDGRTARWLAATAARCRLWLGTTFLESDGRDFYDTFVLFDPEGREAGRVRKSKPASMEAYFFRGAPGSHVLETPLGRIGVAICYEAALQGVCDELARAGVVLALLPHSAPMPALGYGVTVADRDAYVGMLDGVASAVAVELRAPAVMANKTGPWRSALPWPFPAHDSRFPGRSTIAARDGARAASLGDEEGWVVAEVHLGDGKPNAAPTRRRGKWARPVPRFARAFAVPETLGAVSYRASRARRRAAENAIEPAGGPRV